MHFTVVTDPQCSNAGFAVKAPKPFVGESEFYKALETGHPGTLDKIITGRFIGRFVWNPNRMPKRALVLIEVSDLHLTMKR